MNLVLSIIFVVFILFNLFEFYLDYLNSCHLKVQGDVVPAGFESLISREKLADINKYTLEKMRFAAINKTYNIIILIFFFFAGLINVYNSVIFNFDLPFYLNGIVYLYVLMLIYSFLEIPFNLYSTFRIEKKYGFNTMTGKLWVIDFVKSTIISFILTGILVMAGFAIIRNVAYWWFWVWLMFFLFTIVMMYLSPYVLEPLFNKFEPVEDQELKDQLTEKMRDAGIRVSKILKMDASKRTKHTNAYFSGIGRVKRIVLFDTLIEKMSKDEVTAVIAHEAGHWKKKHIIKRIILIESIVLIALFAAYLLIQNNYVLNFFNIGGRAVYPSHLLLPCSVIILSFLFSIVMFPFTPLMNYSSRKHEKEADTFAVDLVGTSRDLISALKKLSTDNLSNLHPHPWYSLFHYSHPPVTERIEFLENIDKN